MHEGHLRHKHAHTLSRFFSIQPSHNLEWHNVVAFIQQNGTVQDNAHLQGDF